MHIKLTDKEKELIRNFGAFGYDAEIISSILGWKLENVNSSLQDEKSEFYKLYAEGVNISEYKITLKLLELSLTGDLKALEKFEERTGRKKEKKSSKTVKFDEKWE